MEQTRLISALKAQAVADKEKALMALELLTKHGVGIGDHTAKAKLKACESANINYNLIRFDESITEYDLLLEVKNQTNLLMMD